MPGLEMMPKGEEAAAAEPVLAILTVLEGVDLAHGAPVAGIEEPLCFNGAAVTGIWGSELAHGALVRGIARVEGCTFSAALSSSLPLRISPSQMKHTLPNGKCCTTGLFPKHSASHIFIIPLCTLTQLATVVAMSYSIGECSEKGPLFNECILAIEVVYRLAKGGVLLLLLELLDVGAIAEGINCKSSLMDNLVSGLCDGDMMAEGR